MGGMAQLAHAHCQDRNSDLTGTLSKFIVTLSSMFPDFHAMMQRLPLYMYSREGTSWSIEKENRSPTTTWIYYHYLYMAHGVRPVPTKTNNGGIYADGQRLDKVMQNFPEGPPTAENPVKQFTCQAAPKDLSYCIFI